MIPTFSTLDRLRILRKLIESLRRNAFNEYDMNVERERERERERTAITF